MNIWFIRKRFELKRKDTIISLKLFAVILFLALNKKAAIINLNIKLTKKDMKKREGIRQYCQVATSGYVNTNFHLLASSKSISQSLKKKKRASKVDQNTIIPFCTVVKPDYVNANFHQLKTTEEITEKKKERQGTTSPRDTI